MALTEKQIQSFIDAWQQEFGETLSLDEATMEANRLVDFFIQMREALQLRKVPKDTKDSSLRDAWEKSMRR